MRLCHSLFDGLIYICLANKHDDVIKWKQFPRYWLFVRGIHRSPVNSPHKGQWRGALMFSLICAWINGWVNNREAGDLRRHRAHHDVTVMNGAKHQALQITSAGLSSKLHCSQNVAWNGVDRWLPQFPHNPIPFICREQKYMPVPKRASCNDVGHELRYKIVINT